MTARAHGRLDRAIERLRQRLAGAEEMRRALISDQLDTIVGGPAERLDDAREALRAIREGEVDGVVVGGEEVILVGQAHGSYRALVDRMPQGAITASIHGDVLYANERLAAMVGRERDRLLGQPLSEAIGTHALDDLLRGTGPLASASEATILRADGATIHVGVAAERIEGVDAVTFVLTDLTERDRHVDMQERVQRNDRFLAVLAHELRTPLGAVRNAVEILDRSGAVRDDERFALDVIGRQSETLTRLVDDLLNMHRLSEDRIALQREPVDLRDIIQMAVDAARPGFDAKQQRIDVVVPEAPVHADADVVRLAQVLGNVLVNASEYMAVGGRAKVALERVSSASGTPVACIEVADDGVGVPPELLEKIFEPYAQVPRQGQAFAEGLGLGLSVARRLVQLHGGTIVARSEGVGRGATIVIELPVCAPPSESAPPAADDTPSGAGVRILIADDDEDSATSLSHLLALLGHETHVAHSGEEAIRLADELRPDVVILDIGMPGIDGWSAGRTLRDRPWATNLILYALSGWSQAKARERTTAAGFDHHFAKPLAFADLARDLHERVGKRRP